MYSSGGLGGKEGYWLLLRKWTFSINLASDWADIIDNSGEDIYLLVPPLFDAATEIQGRELIAAGWGYATILNENGASRKEPPAKWTKPTDRQAEQGVGAVVTVGMQVKKMSWHRRGDYFVTVSPEGKLFRS